MARQKYGDTNLSAASRTGRAAAEDPPTLSTQHVLALTVSDLFIYWRSLLFVDQNHIGIGIGAKNAQRFTIRRPLEICDLFGRKARELLANRYPIQRLNPNIVRAFIANRICYCLAIGCKSYPA